MDTRRTDRTDRSLGIGIVAGATGVLILVAVGVLVGDRVPGVDAWGLDALRVEPGSRAETVAEAVSDGLRIALAAATAAAIGWLLWRGRTPATGRAPVTGRTPGPISPPAMRSALASALGYAALFVVFTGSSELLKEAFARPHPTDPADVSFPSTHVVMVTAGALVAVGILGRLSPRPRVALATLAAVAIAVTAATRVLLGEHYVTDVAGTALGYTGIGLLAIRLLSGPRAARQPVGTAETSLPT